MKVSVQYGEGKKQEIKLGKFIVATDQMEEEGGDETAPNPFQLFVMALAGCAAYYVREFCNGRELSTEGIHVTQTIDMNWQTKAMRFVRINIEVPESFPEKYRGAVARAAEQCSVKKAISQMPEIEIQTTVA
jgi:putative redox protein